jgi:hypothetical protein
METVLITTFRIGKFCVKMAAFTMNQSVPGASDKHLSRTSILVVNPIKTLITSRTLTMATIENRMSRGWSLTGQSVSIGLIISSLASTMIGMDTMDEVVAYRKEGFCS